MPFTANLPEENTDPWYAPLVTAWGSLKAFVNGLETTLGEKADSSSLGTAASQDSSAFATAAQGTLADSAVQPGDLGTAASAATSDFATAAQGATADSAVQPGDLGSAASADVTDFATAAQGSLADSAVQPDSLRLPILMTQAAYDALDPKVAGQVYITQG